MELLKVLHKYQPAFSISKLPLYKELENGKAVFIEANVSYQWKQVEQLFIFEVLYRGLLNKKAIDTVYESFVFENQEIFEHINYQEKQSLLFHQLIEVVATLQYFTFAGERVYIPYVNTTLNKRYVEDIQVVALKQYQEEIRRGQTQTTTFISLYGMLPYISDFSSLEYLTKREQNTYFYFSQTQRVFVFTEAGECIETIPLTDKYHTYTPTLEQAKIMIHLFLDKEDVEVLYEMHAMGCISDKGYKKIKKKLG